MTHRLYFATVGLLFLALGCASRTRDRYGLTAVPSDGGVLDAAAHDTGTPDATPSDRADAGFEACESTLYDALSASLPADIIWVVDNSASMRDEESYVQTNLNRFSSRIASSGTDHHVVMISATARINVPPPLGGSERFLAINQQVNSHDALELIISTYPLWQSFLRADAIKHFVVVSDDESNMSAGEFRTALASLSAPGFLDGFVFHAIVAETLGFAIPPGPCFDKAENIGAEYISLQETSSGVFSSVCQTNWTPVFDALAEAVLASTSLPCAFAIPAPPAGQVFVADQVNLAYTPSGAHQTFIPQVADASACGPDGGWYYNAPSAPTRIETCASTCETLSSDMSGTVSVAFGCATIVY